MKIEFVKPAQGFAHVAGDVTEMGDDQAKKLIELGFAVEAKPVKPKGDEKKK